MLSVPLLMSLFAVLFCLFAATVVLPVMVMAGQAAARSQRRTAYERCAGQLAHLQLWLCSVCGVIGVGGSLWLLLQPLEEMIVVASQPGVDVSVMESASSLLCALPFVRTAVLGWGVLLVLAVLLACGMVIAAQRRMALLSAACAVCACLVSAAVMALGGATVWGVLQPDLSPIIGLDGTAAVFEVLLPFYAGRLGLLFALCCLGFALSAAGGLALLWLVLRRHADDYGRDHYMLAARWCAGWGVFGGGLTGMLGGLSAVLWAVARGVPITGMFWAVLSAAVLIPWVMSLCWGAVARSQNPMRLKNLMWCGMLLLILYTLMFCCLYTMENVYVAA